MDGVKQSNKRIIGRCIARTCVREHFVISSFGCCWRAENVVSFMPSTYIATTIFNVP